MQAGQVRLETQQKSKFRKEREKWNRLKAGGAPVRGEWLARNPPEGNWGHSWWQERRSRGTASTCDDSRLLIVRGCHAGRRKRGGYSAWHRQEP